MAPYPPQLEIVQASARVYRFPLLLRRFDYQPHSSPEEPRDALGTPKPVPKTCPHSAASSGIQDLALSKTQRA
jgi:hypothetical protein